MATLHSSIARSASPPASAKGIALGLLLAINLFNYIDRYVLAAVEPAIQKQFFPGNPPNAEAWMGSLVTAFIVSYMIAAPIFGWIAERTNRWLVVGVSVLVWSLATAASGASAMVGGFTLLLVTRLFVGIGEAGYGPAAPTLLSDYFSEARRGMVLSVFYLAIPVGAALGFVIGGFIAQRHGWPSAFFAVVIPGLLMGAFCLFLRDPSQAHGGEPGRAPPRRAGLGDYLMLARTPSYVLDSLGMTAMTFAAGGISFWIPKYFSDARKIGTLAEVNSRFGVITVVAGFLGTIVGGFVGDWVRRWTHASYFLVSAIGILLACPFVLLMVHSDPPLTWRYLSVVIFFLFFNTGPTNTILANVAHPSTRATAFAFNILIIHALGDAVSPPILGKISHTSWDHAFDVVAGAMALAGGFWLCGCFFLKKDMDQVHERLAASPAAAAVMNPIP